MTRAYRKNSKGICRDCGKSEPDVEFYVGHAPGVCKKCECIRKSVNKKKNIEATRKVKNRAHARLRLKMDAYKESVGCQNPECQCNYSFEELEFHHVDPSQKEFVMGKVRSWTQFEREIKKCIVLCWTCHMLAHGKNPKSEPRKKGRPARSHEELIIAAGLEPGSDLNLLDP